MQKVVQIDAMQTGASCRLKILMDSAKILYLNAVLDSYEGLMIMRTADERRGDVMIYTTTCHKDLVLLILEKINAEGVRVDVVEIDFEDKLY